MGEPDPLPESEVFETYKANRDVLMRRPLDEHARFLWDSCEKEHKKEAGLRPVPESALISKFGAGQFSAIPCFVVTQACGKHRRASTVG